MPRGPRPSSKTGIYHFITRGVNKKKIFHRTNDFDFYLSLAKEYQGPLGVEVYHYCIMSNHAHFLLKTPDISILGKFAHFIQRRYAYYYCKTYSWAGQVFQSRYKSIPVESEEYLLECGRYIERNPVRAKLVERIEDYSYHSHAFYAQGKANDILTPSPAYLALSEESGMRRGIYKEYVAQTRPYEILLDKVLI